MDIQQIYEVFGACSGVTTDSRTLKGGELFVALRGDKFDGNEYALKALSSGASYAVIAEDSQLAKSSDDPRLIKVPDTLKTLQELARWHRCMTFVDGKPLPVIALTGTNGKTTTKELVREVLSVKYNVTATTGNLNNSIGVPLTLLNIAPDTQIAIIEMGASHPGDIKELVDIALPNYGLVTNVGKAHLLGFGSFEGVKNAKGELYDYLRRTADKVFLNVDNPHLCSMASERNLYNDPERPYSLVIPYGLEYQRASVLPSDMGNPFLSLEVEGRIVRTNLIGTYNADNVMAALCVGRYFGVTLDEAVTAIESYVPSNNRSQMLKTDRNTIIVDAYNANPTSMAAALDNFSRISVERRILMLGNMLELGKESLEEHVIVIKKALAMGVERICLVGEEFLKALESVGYEGDEIVYFATSDELAAWVRNEDVEGCLVLVKGSRGTKMERVIPAL